MVFGRKQFVINVGLNIQVYLRNFTFNRATFFKKTAKKPKRPWFTATSNRASHAGSPLPTALQLRVLVVWLYDSDLIRER
jgi:hypothetical protein